MQLFVLKAGITFTKENVSCVIYYILRYLSFKTFGSSVPAILEVLASHVTEEVAVSTQLDCA